MRAYDRYRSAAAFRAALEQRLRTEGQASGVPLNRLRKEAAFHRLLARLHRVAPDLWALKGGQALIARLGIEVRATKDVDANWRATRRELEEALSAVEDLELDDWFTFRIGDAHLLQGEGEHGALRYAVTARLDGRVFEHVSLDVNIVGPRDMRPVEIVRTRRNPFAFIDEPPLEIPMVLPAQQLAEKLHAYARRYRDEQASSRAKDLFDMLVIADQIALPNAAALSAAAQETFHLRETSWPPELHEPPTEWARPWSSFIADYPLRCDDLVSAFTALEEFWMPILTTAAPADAVWRADLWRWTD